MRHIVYFNSKTTANASLYFLKRSKKNCVFSRTVDVWPIFQHQFGHEIHSRTLLLFATVCVCYRSKIIRHWHASLTPRIVFSSSFCCFTSLVTHLSVKREKNDEIIPVQLSTLKGFIPNKMLCIRNWNSFILF